MMEKVSRFIEDAREPLTVRAIQDGRGGRKSHVDQARLLLIAEGYVEIENGPRGAKLHCSAKPYRADDTSNIDPPSPERPPECPPSGGAPADPAASPRPPVPTGTGTGTRSQRDTHNSSRKRPRFVRRGGYESGAVRRH